MVAACSLSSVLWHLPRHGQEPCASQGSGGVQHPVHPQIAGGHQPGQPCAGTGLANREAGQALVQRGVSDAHLNQPAVQHHRELRRGCGHDGASRRYCFGGGEHCRSVGFPSRHAQGRPRVRRRLVVQGLGTRQAGGGGHWPCQRLGDQRRIQEYQDQLARIRQAGERLQHAGPDQVHHCYPRS